MKEILNSYLNANSVPRIDFSFLIEGYPYLEVPKRERFCKKAAILDCDGVLNRRDAQELYKDVFYLLFKEDFENILKIDERIKKPEDVPRGEKELSNFFKSYKIRKEKIDLACEEAAENFIKFSLVKGAKRFVYRLEKELGYEVALISGCFKKAVERVAEEIGIKRENVYATEYFCDETGEFKDMRLVLGSRKLERKNFFLKKNIQTSYGCCFVVEDEYELNAPYMKAGINPSIIVGKRVKSLPFDVYTFCPEARDNLEELIKKVYGFEYGWVSIHLLGREGVEDLLDFCKEIRSLNLSNTEIKEDFCRALLKIVDLKERYRLIPSSSWLKELILDLIITKDEIKSKELIKKIWNLSCSNIPELNF